jgi:imidazole glycerol-phosphate synthase subunit HisH
MTPGPSIAVVDYGMGNRRSVQKAFEHVGTRAEITSDHERIRRADGVVVPGVGAFPLAMERMNASGLGELIIELARHDTPILGICLGMQLLFDRSEELGTTSGLGLIGGEVTGLSSGGQRIPHIGWNEVRFERASVLTEGLPAGGAPFYHVHSLAARPREPADVVGSTEYGERFATIVARGSIYGVQFHPEKSSRNGLQMLGNFAAVCARRPVSAG